ncbi:AMP-binding protein [Geomonas sp. RF6]|uniref:AMP-dependent synthetase/ligase n=1 Tax=Geomonas sp. RF6 TaxID=2897342 RepID=UPI001E45FD65|nr:AMP-binding protein [Geomonas sp. RF6]UFS71135.1 AMP-binding protein [Geomonas sp. RF6]
MLTGTVVELLEKSVERNPEKAALRQKVGGGWQEITYRTLGQISDGVAAGLMADGFGAADHAALLAPSSPRWLYAYFGILKAGGIVVPVDKELKSGELKHVLADSESRVLFTDSTYLRTVLQIADELPRLQQVVLLDEGRTPSDEAAPARWRGRSGKLLERLKSLEALLVQKPSPLPPRAPSDTAVIIYTSGTTGRAKGAMLSHGNIVSNIDGAIRHLGLDQTIHTLSLLPISHVFEQVCGVLLPLSLGGTVSFCESVKKFAENLAEVRPTFFLGVPALYRKMLDRIVKQIGSNPVSRALFSFPLTRPLVKSRLRKRLGGATTFISGGAALDTAVSEGFERLGLVIFQGYGITETSPVIAAECATGRKTGTVGRPLGEVEIRIDEPNEEMVGEILVRGPNVMQGYYKDPAATEQALKDGWYRTGDLGRVDAQGYLTICGRVKNVIVTPNGKNVYPEEVEIEILKSPLVAEVVVYGHRSDPHTEEIHAMIFPDEEGVGEYCEREKRAPLSAEELETLLQGEVTAACQGLASYKRVKKIMVRKDEFPKTTTRKIKRYELHLPPSRGGSSES